jgi:hypothetical protein
VDPSTIDGLAGLIGPARLSTYLDAYQGREDLALRLYSWNAALSSALWGPLGVLEVIARNALHNQLVERTGRPDWWADPRLDAQLLPRERGAIADAVGTAGERNEEPSADDVVAASGFGLWVGLLSEGVPRHPLHSYETALWQPRLRRAFPFYAGGRKQLHAELDSIRRTRNRVAHHEPIFRTNLPLLGDLLARIAGYVDPAAETYIRGSERLTAILDAKRAFIAAGEATF